MPPRQPNPSVARPLEGARIHQPLTVIEPASNSTSPHFTSLRRTTRSTTTSSGESSKRSILDIGKYQYVPSTPPRKRAKVEIKVEDVEDTIIASTPKSNDRSIVKVETVDTKPSISPKTPKSTKKPLPQLSLTKPHPPPPLWEEQYRLIEEMRKNIVAPVDTMGCERPRTIVDNDPKTLRFHILISLMLSSQTKDPVTSAAVTTLHETLRGGLTARSLADASTELIQQCINKVGFWRRKADYIKDAAIHLLEKEDGDVPKTLEGLCELKGVGPKMAFLALQCAWDINAGIGVDVHVHRITNRLKWHKPPTTTPEGTRLNLQSWLPPQLHRPINPMLVGFGQIVCLPVGPRCDVCLLGRRKLCPSRITNVKSEGRKEVVFIKNEGQEAKVEIAYESQSPPVDAEAGLIRIKDEPSPPPPSFPVVGLRDGVKMERDQDLETIVQEPGMKKVDEVLEILDRVDGAKDVDGEPLGT
ncbi:hypothetical protein I203_101000 [Kwoniella mangroviensis CBS 8507]|uniref:uncharacterized protein n=1 Tax=Kwoniella mangroviensis CBS 8507 TaxID=1296122 RepID=UPI00080CF5D8|nr:endonuclease III [Kwoniella mangroviensis CBS 8507]OCF67980.1 endonuclease III [Kwoniella mangroviensis CBS 8507]